MLNNEFLKMQKLAGLITESEYKAKLNKAKLNEEQSSSPKLLAFVDGSDRQTLNAYKELGFKVRSANGQYLAELDFKGYDWAAVLAMLEDCEDMGIKPSMMWNNKKYDFVKAMELADEKAAGDSYGDTGVGTRLNEISSPSYLFIDGDNQLELDKDEFKKYIMSNLNKIKSLWGGNWEEDNIQKSEIEDAIELFYKRFSNDIQSDLDLTSQNPSKEYLDTFSDNTEEMLLTRFANYLNDVL